jgi:acetyl-CoA C-acetyltransferase
MSREDPRAPVIVGAGQVSDHSEELSPLELMVEATRRAVSDSGSERILDELGSIHGVDSLSWPAADPGRALAEELGLDPAGTVRSRIGGNSPLALLADACSLIQAGDLDTVLIPGSEAFNPVLSAMRAGTSTGWPDAPTEDPDRYVGTMRDASDPAESAAGLVLPVNYYPFLDNALRIAEGQPADGHLERLAGLWARFSEVASRNPAAWAREFPDAGEIGTVGESNRMISHPYPTLLTANVNVDQGAALIVCSAARAEAAGVPRDRWVFVHGIAEANDHWVVGTRDALHRSPAIAACGRSALEHAGIGIDDVGHLDIYSCFPSAVRIAAAELGFDLADSRPPTVTGGLTFAGGPGSNYVTHSLAAMTQVLREDSESTGLVTGLGWYVTKHAVGILSASPPARPFAGLDLQAEVDALPSREIAADTTGRGPLEAYTASYGRDNDVLVGTASCLLEDGRRAFARSADPDTLDALVGDDPAGRELELDGSGGFTLA